MNIFEKRLLEMVNQIIEEDPSIAESIDFESVLSTFSNDSAEMLKKSLIDKSPEMLRLRKKDLSQFERRNQKRWQALFNALETHIVICTEVGEMINETFRRDASESNDIVFDLLIRLHARACQISEEVLLLLKSGFADSAHARWRALHEVTATAMFILKHGRECAERFYFHDIIDSYDGMIQLNKYESRLQENGFSEIEVDACKKQRDSLIEKYGKQYAEHYGWAAYIFPNQTKVGFAAIEKDVGLDHLRPYYKWASQNVHAGSKGLYSRLGLNETDDDILLVGRSNSGMADPANATAISLSQITSTLCVYKPTVDNTIMMKIIRDFTDKVGDEVLESKKG